MAFVDAQSIPVNDRSLEAIVTSWFFDIIPMDFRQTAKLINVILQDNGIWSNIGQLGFEKSDLTQVYGPDEIREAIEAAGFSVQKFERVQVPYLQSPYDSVGRHDHVWIFEAKKTKHSERPPRFEYWPEWVSNPSLPIPITDQIQSLKIRSSVYSYVVSLVDGKTSQLEIAAKLASQLSTPPEEAGRAVYSFFTNFFEGQIYREF